MRKAHRNLIESGLRGQEEKLYKTSYFPRSRQEATFLRNSKVRPFFRRICSNMLAAVFL